ncbi:L,D-transpeptidase [Streptacidiphilus jiangxiensis]|uniref:Lipoprotein-anchoring transpeptidase ErfK/SrfK n=1 Tax=Streptacidiphilus jiangxiensis TaxID=235985 RepID=A0A1H7FK51_STRJI|nr:Ig-like domain-containing protein [Streptacidiphilus jiangxiensis]SEK25627.1 Lipoprotein-anchoring transpeptidase ErfK/SrfK [Streptacidiphilus jiangxiensis]
MATAVNWTRRSVVAGMVGTPVLLLAACSGSGSGSKDSGASGGSSPAASKATVTVTPKDGATGVDMAAPVTVRVAQGTLESVTLTGSDGKQITGRLSADRTGWTSASPLASSAGYKVAAVTKDSAGTTATVSSAFTTGKPAKTFVGVYTPDDSVTVGVGMPVSINFNNAITNKAAVQKAITVTAEPPVEIVGHWFGDTRLDFRPQEYWKPGTKVTLTLALKDVEGAPGRYGTQAKVATFTIGRSQTSVADLGAKQLTVTRDGKVTQTFPISGGSPEHTTWAGKMVISEKLLQTRMDSRTVNLGGEYDIPDVPHAQRLTNSGTFIHGNYWSSGIFGSVNTSHGCVGLHDVQGASDPSTPAAQFYNSSIVGDVVQVINSGDRTVDPSNGLNGWNMDWSAWKAGSAV